jgi:hypothetical protein
MPAHSTEGASVATIAAAVVPPMISTTSVIVVEYRRLKTACIAADKTTPSANEEFQHSVQPSSASFLPKDRGTVFKPA